MPFWSSQCDVTQRPPLLLPAPALVPRPMPAWGSARAVSAGSAGSGPTEHSRAPGKGKSHGKNWEILERYGKPMGLFLGLFFLLEVFP